MKDILYKAFFRYTLGGERSVIIPICIQSTCKACVPRHLGSVSRPSQTQETALYRDWCNSIWTLLPPRKQRQRNNITTPCSAASLVHFSVCANMGMLSFCKSSSSPWKQLEQEEKLLFYFYKGVKETETMYQVKICVGRFKFSNEMQRAESLNVNTHDLFTME